MTNWKCDSNTNEITPELTGQVSPNRHNLQLCRWANGRVGAIVPLNDYLMLYFSEVTPDSPREDPQLDFKPTTGRELEDPGLNSHIISCGGIVARWLIESRALHPSCCGIMMLNDPNFRKNILKTFKENPFLEPLYERHLEAAHIKAQALFEAQQNELRTKPGAWKPENKREFEFSPANHLKDERRMLEFDERNLYPFFRQEDVEFMRAIAQDYQEYIQYKFSSTSADTSTQPEKEIQKPKKEKKEFKPTDGTFNMENTTEERLILIFNYCIGVKWLDTSTRVDDWLKLFSGVPSKVTLVWNYKDRPALRDLFKMMAYDVDTEQQTFLSPRKGYLTIVSSHFVSEKPSKNKPLKYIVDLNCRHREGDKQKIELCRRILAYPPGEEIDTDAIAYDIMQEGMPDVTFNQDNAALQAGLRTPRKTIRSPK